MRGLYGVIAPVVFIALLTAGSAKADLVDFESHPGPHDFTSAEPPLTFGLATFALGQTLTAQEFLPADQTTVYGVAFPVLCSGCSDTIKVTFSTPVNGFSALVLNGDPFPVTYTVADNVGDSVSVRLSEDFNSGAARVRLGGSGITSVLISGNAGSEWDFSIDNVTYNVPDPSTYGLVEAGVVCAALWIRRRR
jgi:hypothetical protein